MSDGCQMLTDGRREKFNTSKSIRAYPFIEKRRRMLNVTEYRKLSVL